MDALNSFGLRLRHARKRRDNMPQMALAKAVGVTQPSISDLESGETKEVSGPLLIRIAKVLRVRPEWLVTGEQPMEPQTENLKQDELELLKAYRVASARWKLALRHIAGLPDNEQEEVASGVNILVAEILGRRPFPADRMGDGWTRPDREREREKKK